MASRILKACIEFGATAMLPLLGFHLTGITTGALLSFTKNTRNLAGFVLLALRPTV
jgi:hypothetical protein